MLGAGQERVERGLLQRGADRAAHLGALRDDVEARDARLAGGGRQQRREHEHSRRLARAVWPEEAVDLARRHPQVDAVDGAHAALEVLDEAFDLDPVLVLVPGLGLVPMLGTRHDLLPFIGVSAPIISSSPSISSRGSSRVAIVLDGAIDYRISPVHPTINRTDPAYPPDESCTLIGGPRKIV